MKKLFLLGTLVLCMGVFFQGTAQNACPTGQVNCNGKCVDLGSDPNNCGACNIVCPAGYACVAGTCVLKQCPTGQVNCNGRCVDLGSDPNNCGACGIVCPAGYTCVGGTCVPK